MQITRGKIRGARKVVVYGPEGIGKSTFASQFPDPLFIDTEGSTRELDVARFPAPSSFTMVKEMIREVISNPGLCKTLVIDTMDWLEQLAIKAVLAEHNKQGIEDFSYGSGYRYVFEKIGEVLNLLSEVIEKGINVVITAHAALRKFEQPDEMGAYDRYSMKLIDSPRTSVSAAVKVWADMVLFANYKTIVVTDSKTKKSKAQGGTRVMYTSHHSCWDAKNRFRLPDELPFSYESVKHIFEEADPPKDLSGSPAQTVDPMPPREAVDKNPPSTAQSSPTTKNPDGAASGPPADTATEAKAREKPPTHQQLMQERPVTDADLDKRIPKALRDLMLKDNIGEWDIENFTEAKGFVPAGTKVADYATVSPGIIEGLFVAQWTKVRDQIVQMRKDQEIPFD